MAFNTLYFLFGFLPICLLLYLVLPKSFKNAALLLISLAFFAWDSPEYFLLLILSILFNYFTGIELGRLQEQKRSRDAKAVLITAVVFNLLILCFFKYLVQLLGRRELPMPLGLSFYTFSLLSFLFDVYRGKAPAPRNPIDFGVFVTFFPKFVSGPIVQYKDFAEQIPNHPFHPDLFGGGARKFIIGLSKKLLLADALGVTFHALAGQASLTAAGAWLCVISYSLMLYFDFSGYSDMAIGLAGMFGFRFAPNFSYPYLSDSVSEFWRRWHISLGAWFRDYVYIPLGGSRCGTLRTIGNLLVVWILTGIWHGTGGGFVVWGLYYGLLLILEKFVLKDLLEKLPKAVRILLTLLLVMIGWIFFFSPSPAAAFRMIGQLFGSSGWGDGFALYHWGIAWKLIIAGILASLPVFSNIGRQMMRRDQKWIPLSLVYYGLLLILCISAMMNATYTTFLYAQF